LNSPGFRRGRIAKASSGEKASDIKTTMQYYSAVTKEQRVKAARAINELLKAEKSSGEWYV
jgi:hypothetical protein